MLLLLGGVIAFSAFWYSAGGREVGNEPAFGGSYVEGVAGAPDRLNPLFAAQNDVDEDLVALIFAGLTRLDNHGAAFPDLAESWSITNDGRTFTFTLRSGLLWQDGQPLNADDIVFTYNLLRAQELRAAPALARLLADASVTRIDDRHVAFNLPQPFAPLPAYLTLGILPAHLLRDLSPAAIFDAGFNQRPVGAGPYRLEELTPQRAVLVANPAHHRGQPFIQRFELRFYRDEPSVLAALRDHQVDGALLSNGLSANDVYAFEDVGLLSIELPASEVTYIYLNLSVSLFQDARVRQALLQAINRDGIVEGMATGQLTVADSLLSAGSWAHDAKPDRYVGNAASAAALLEEAGWRLGPGGVRMNGARPLAFTLSTNNDPSRLRLAESIARDWEAIGVQAKVNAVGSTALVRDLLEPRAYEAALFADQTGADPDPYAAWHSSQTGPEGHNLSLLREPRFDRILEEARLVAPPERRRELYAEFQDLYAQQLPALPLFVRTYVYLQEESVKGVRAGYLPAAAARFWQVNEWYRNTR